MRRAFKEASIAALPHTYCVILNKLLHISGPWMPHLGSKSLWCCLCSVAMRIKRTNSYTVLRRVSDIVFFVVVQSLSHVCLVVTPWTAARQAPLSSAVSQSLLKFMSIESLMLYNHLILCCCLLFLPSVFPSIRVFSYEPAFSHQVVKVLQRQPSINVTSVLLVTTPLLLLFIQMAFPLLLGLAPLLQVSLSVLSVCPILGVLGSPGKYPGVWVRASQPGFK